jgi:hypothetical protein
MGTIIRKVAAAERSSESGSATARAWRKLERWE